MARKRYVSPRAQYVAELALFVIPTAVAFFLSGLPFIYKIGGFLGATVLAGSGKYVLIFRESVALVERKRTEFLDQQLELIVNDYSQRYDTEYDIRANVMIPQEERSFTQQNPKSRRHFLYYIFNIEYEKSRFLQIAYCAGGGPDKDICEHDCGEHDETTTEWSIEKPVQGNCGRAFTAEEIRVAGRLPGEDEWPGETTEEQDRDTGPVNSILSVPIWKPGGDEVGAVLNIDAHAPLRETNFQNDSVQADVEERYAEQLDQLLEH
jgi:hypothetical protein